jgi:hypothetical protein
MRFVHRYNEEHSHSAILYLTAQRHAGQIAPCSPLAMKSIQRVRQNAPRRWSSSSTRDWTPVEAATLNQERDTVVQAVITRPTGEPVSPSRPGNAQAMARSEGHQRSGATRGHAHSASFRASMAMMAHRTFPESERHDTLNTSRRTRSSQPWKPTGRDHLRNDENLRQSLQRPRQTISPGTDVHKLSKGVLMWRKLL